MISGRMLAALSCGALLAVAGCGNKSSGAPIPADQAQKLIRAIQAADQYNSDGSCAKARKKVGDARFLLDRVPAKVDPDVRRGLRDGLSRLDGLISTECQRKLTTEPDTTPTETTDTSTITTETTPTETTHTATTQTQPTTTTETQTQTTPTSTAPTSTTPTTTTGNGGTPPGNSAGGGNGASG